MATNVLPTDSMLRVRSYQQEMLDRSLKENVVVVLDTGGGKTLIAAMRIKHELERCQSGQMAWFLSPGVDLCIQQHKFLSAFLPSVRTRLLIGSDNMDRWGEQRIWDAALDQVRIVVSTYAVLSDALQHEFVKLSNLALIVFDEAHHCNKKHPANVIMQKFYHPAKAEGTNVLPHILGLSASMVMRSDLNSFQTIERNLDSIGVTPRVHRSDLIAHVNRPDFVRIEFRNDCAPDHYEPEKSLTDLHNMLPLVNSAHVPLLGRNSFTSPGVDAKGFSEKLQYVHTALGKWGAGQMARKTLEALAMSNENLSDGSSLPVSRTDRPSDPPPFADADLTRDRTSHLPHDADLSDKARRLLEFLGGLSPETTGIVFVQRRVTASLLCDLISAHPLTKYKFRPGPFVGASGYSVRQTALSDLIDLRSQRNVLEDFRAGLCNLLIATPAAEEGLDIPSCNLVCCFDPPPNLKSFIQRRGRARHQQSIFAILVDAEDSEFSLDKWRMLERELIRVCQEDRQLDAEHVEDGDEQSDLVLRHPSSGAIVTADSALQHLYHFCDLLPAQPYIDQRPLFTFNTDTADMFEARVSLPDSLPDSVRYAVSTRRWRSERLAQKDAALVAYNGLLQAGLLNEHLLPLSRDWDPIADYDDADLGSMQKSSSIDIWRQQAHHNRCYKYVSYITMKSLYDEHDLTTLRMITCAPLAATSPITFRWHSHREFMLTIQESVPCEAFSQDELADLYRTTTAIVHAARSDRLAIDPITSCVVLVPDNIDSIEAWLHLNEGQVPFREFHGLPGADQVVRVPLPNQPPFLLSHYITNDDGTTDIACQPFKRHQCLTSVTQTNDKRFDRTESRAKSAIFPAVSCSFDRVDFRYALLSYHLPQIFCQLHDHTMAHVLRASILKDIPFANIENTITALRASQADRNTNYQHLEFVGDTVLKFVVSYNLYAQHWTWPEGFLSKRRMHLVCNQRLASEALKLGLDRYILTEPIHRKSWRLPTFVNLLPTHQLSVKVLADVVESLIGATFVDMDMDLHSVRLCVHRLIPAIAQEVGQIRLPPEPPHAVACHLSEVESLIGHSFSHKGLLVEALTHSNSGAGFRSQSYQRLEFLGDSVLDMLVVTNTLRCQSSKEPIPPARLTLIKSCLVNRDLLGYFCLAWNMQKSVQTVRTDRSTGIFAIEDAQQDLRLWKFMRHDSEQVKLAQDKIAQRFADLGGHITARLQDALDLTYPWKALVELRPEKFYSDLIESILGALFVDSGGDLTPCQAFIDRIGLTTYLHHLVNNTVDLSHPRSRMYNLAGSKKVDFAVRPETRESNSVMAQTFGGSLMIEDNIIQTVSAMHSEDLVIVILAEAGIEYLAGHG